MILNGPNHYITMALLMLTVKGLGQSPSPKS